MVQSLTTGRCCGRLNPLLLCNHTVVEEFRRLALRLQLMPHDAVPAASLASRASATCPQSDRAQPRSLTEA